MIPTGKPSASSAFRKLSKIPYRRHEPGHTNIFFVIFTRNLSKNPDSGQSRPLPSNAYVADSQNNPGAQTCAEAIQAAFSSLFISRLAPPRSHSTTSRRLANRSSYRFGYKTPNGRCCGHLRGRCSYVLHISAATVLRLLNFFLIIFFRG